ncbi:hypothetical protein GF382_01430 [Candidatus Falkowbacteria bacterium]|nr:hypothetical protein [Candidatus Falkowbacteria bacterium]
MKKIIISIMLLTLFLSPTFVFAAAGNNPPAEPVTLDNPLGENVTPQQVIGQIINAVLGIVGSLALIMFIWGGLVWMTAAGSPEKISQGRMILLWATIGLVVVFSSFTLVRFIIQRGLGA